MGWWVMIMMGDFFCPVNSEVKVLATEIFGGWDFGVGLVVGFAWIYMVRGMGRAASAGVFSAGHLHFPLLTHTRMSII